MKTLIRNIILSLPVLLFTNGCNNNSSSGIYHINDLDKKVEVLRDSYGINHIYAKTQHDLFYMQGYLAARDRLFQFEIWRRQSTGTVAEILGEKELKRDIGTRLFMFRGDMNTEQNHYHSQGKEIIGAYVDGVNAYIDESLKDTSLLPFEFGLLGIKPGHWTPEVVISRHQGLLGNINTELSVGMAVAKAGEQKVKELLWLHPKDPDISLDPSIRGELLNNKILDLYRAYRQPVKFYPEDIGKTKKLANNTKETTTQPMGFGPDWISIGSNNWVINPGLSANGHSIMANDPHRSITIPSLRYMVHLVAPGWNVIGGGEPEIPGVSIGHNEYGAWGLTVFGTDGEDLYVYELNPANPEQYRYKGEWEEMSIIHDSINVKDRGYVYVDYKYTRHGPVTYIDSVNNIAYAVRCAWLEPGGSPYLASLRIDQAKTWEEFREACSYSNIPGENMIWTDVEGNIGWQAVGIAPIRRNFSGMVPVPGNGRYEWDGYLPISEKPHILNPEENFFSTANQNVIPESYDHWDAIGFRWSDPYRGNRIKEVLGSDSTFTTKDMIALQTDYFSIPASILLARLKEIQTDNNKIIEAMKLFENWDFQLDKGSIQAGIYATWEREIIKAANDLFVPEEIKNIVRMQLKTIIDYISDPETDWGKDYNNKADFLEKTFLSAINHLSKEYGNEPANWVYGQDKFKHIIIEHPLSKIVDEELKEKINTCSMPRGGNSYTIGASGEGNNQVKGASFRMIVNTGDWDSAVGTNTPGQSGNPDSKYYKNLFKMWANDQYFPVFYSKEKIESVCDEKSLFLPAKK